jgi:hypothetical protein
MATRRIRRTYAPQYDRFNPPYQPQPQPRLSLGNILFYTVFFLLLAFMIFVGTAERLGYPLTSFLPQYAAQPAPTVHAVAPQSAPAPAQSAPQAAPIEQAPAAPIVEQAPAPAVPTAAVIVAPQAAPVVVVPQAAPRIAPDSIVPTVAPAPTIETTAPMVAGKDFQAPSKTCVETERKGEAVHFAQVQDMTPAEMSSVADYLRTGMIAGVAGPCQ